MSTRKPFIDGNALKHIAWATTKMLISEFYHETSIANVGQINNLLAACLWTEVTSAVFTSLISRLNVRVQREVIRC